MSDTAMLTEYQNGPQPVYLRDYQVPLYLIDEVDLHFDIDSDSVLVNSRLRIRHNRLSHSKSNTLTLNGEALELVSIKMDGNVLTEKQFSVTDQLLIIENVPEHFELEITTRIYPQKNTALSGLYRSANTYCTQCEAEGFRRITYFLDRPDILSRYTTTLVADEKKYPCLLSNGNLVASGKSEEGRHWAKWQDPFKKPCYLFALVAGDFNVMEDTFITQSNREVALKIYVDKHCGDQAAHAMFSLKEAMRWDEKVYGREYDLDIYMIVAIGDFNMGAMENKGLNIFNTKYILARPELATDIDYVNILSVIGHEYFHNWSGNRVTCRDWFQLSLKEGLTIFRDQTFSEDRLSRAVMRIREVNSLREVQFPEDAGPLAHPVRPDSYIEINNFYTTTVYNKGAELIRMLQTILGPVLFRKGMDLYFARHDGQAVTIKDYVKAMEDVSGIDLRQFRLWYSQAGTPVLQVEDDYDEHNQTYSLTISQSVPVAPGQAIKKPMHVPIRMGLLDKQGNEIPLHYHNETVETEKVLHLTQSSQTFEFEQVSALPVPSLLRHFSAPVKLHYSYSDKDLQFLFKHDTDPFNRWETGQIYMLRVLLDLIRAQQQDRSLQLPHELVEMFQQCLSQDQTDAFLLAEMLALPSETYLGEQMDCVDVNAIHVAREFVLTELAKQLKNNFLETYQQNHQEPATFIFDMQQVGKRQLKNRCLMYLMQLPDYVDLGMQQFTASLKSNMTDTQAALSLLANSGSSLRETALEQFYAVWQHDPLVVDKWFAIQASAKLPDTLHRIRKLMRHPAFDIKNPNKVYALIGTFGQRNPICFHAEDGEGYAFLREVVHQLDQLNPQIASRMVKPLTTWRRYDSARQEMMLEQLELLQRNNKISKDVYELVTKSLNEVG